MATLGTLTTVTAVVSSLGAPLVPSISREYDVPLETAQWALTASLVTGTIAAPIMGRMGGGRRRRPVVLIGLAVVTLGTLVSAMPGGLWTLLGGRVLQGVGIAMTPLAIAAAREAVDSSRLGRVVGLLSVTTVVGAGLGYPLVGLAADLWGTKGAFWLGFTLCTATWLLVWCFLPAARDTDAGSVDWMGALLLASGTTGLLLAVSQGARWGWLAPLTVGVASMGVLAVTSWVRRTLVAKHPLVDLRLAYRPGMLAANLTGLAVGIGIYMLLTLVVVLVQQPSGSGWGVDGSIGLAGLMMVPYAVLSVLGNRLALALAALFTPEAVLPVGCAIYALATACMALWHDEIWHALLFMSVAGIAGGCTFAALPSLIVRHVPAHETGSALAFNMVLRSLGFALGATLAVTALAVFSAGDEPDESGFVAATLGTSSLMLVAAAGTWLLVRRASLAARTTGT